MMSGLITSMLSQLWTTGVEAEKNDSPKTSPSKRSRNSRAPSREPPRSDESPNQPEETAKVSKIIDVGNYHSVLWWNGIKFDPAGYDMVTEVRDLLDNKILRPRSAYPPPADIAVILKQTVINMEQWGRGTEFKVQQFVSSYMFPGRRTGLDDDGNREWTRSTLPPRARDNKHILSSRCDWFIGYSNGPETIFPIEHIRFIHDSDIREHIQPAKSHILPFLMVEFKAEAQGGILLKAEQQAAVSGTAAVGAIRRLFEKAGIKPTTTDLLAFSLAVSARLVILSVHWYVPGSAPGSDDYYMSRVKTFVTSEEEHVQKVHDVVKSIIDWALGDRLTRIKECLQKLAPIDDPTIPPDSPQAESVSGGSYVTNADSGATTPRQASLSRPAIITSMSEPPHQTIPILQVPDSPSPQPHIYKSGRKTLTVPKSGRRKSTGNETSLEQ